MCVHTLFVFHHKTTPGFCRFGLGNIELRLRASIFVNLVAMRSAMSRHRNGLVCLTPENLSLIKRANYILHCAINSPLAFEVCF